MNDLERKSFRSVKFTEGGSGGFEGYASVFGELDSGGDIVERGAFAEDLPEFLHHGFISMGHDWEGLSIGTIRDAHEDTRGLFLRADYHSTAAAQEARQVAQERLARGKSVGLSIGYQIKSGGVRDSLDGVRHLTNLKLFEVAQVNVPMLRPAGLTGVKGPFRAESSLRPEVQPIFDDLHASLKRERERRDPSMSYRDHLRNDVFATLAEAGVRLRPMTSSRRSSGGEFDGWLAQVEARYGRRS